MDKLDHITTEVPPTSLNNILSDVTMNMEVLSDRILNSITSNQSDLFKQGRAYIGNKSATPTSILRDLLYMEVEELQITKEGDSVARVINSKTKKALIYQIDSIISILDMSVNPKPDRIYLMIGMLLRTQYKK